MIKRVGANRRRRIVFVAALAATSLVIPRQSTAGTKYYVGATAGYWSSTSSWSTTSGGAAGAPVPVTGDLVYLTNATDITQTVTYNVSGTGISLGSLTLDATGGAGNDILLIPSNTLTIAGPTTVGNIGFGTINQSGGTTTSTLLYLGYNGGSGSYFLSAGTLSATGVDSANNSEYVGYNGTGNFNQTGGTHNVSGNLVIGYLQSSSAIYALANSSAKLTVSGNEYVSYAANGGSDLNGGNFYQNAGTHNVIGTLYVGETATGNGFFDLSGGTLQNGTNSNAFLSGETVGDNGYGDFLQTAGTNTVGTTAAGQLLTVGNYGTGQYDLYTTGTTLTVNGNEIVGRFNGSSGTFNQVNGVHSVSGFLSIGDADGSTGNYYLYAGTLAVGTSSIVPTGSEYSNYEIIGASGIGSLTQAGGTNTVGSPAVPQHLEIGYGLNDSNGVGTYTMTGSGSLLNVYGSEYIGDGTVGNSTQYGGTFYQYGGTHNISAGLYVGNGSGASGAFYLGGGSLSANQEFIATGGGASGVFTQTGGTNTILATGTLPGLFLGANSGDYGIYTITGTSSVLTAYDLVVGGTATAAGGTGILNISAGTVTAALQLRIWNTPGTQVEFTGGSLTVGALYTSGYPYNFIWTGGTLTITSAITVDSNFGLGSVFTLGTGMTLVSTGSLTNNGEIDLSGGTLNTSGAVVNNSLITGYGTIISTGTFTNNLQVSESGGSITIVSSGTDINAGTISLAAGHSFSLGSANLSNTGAISLNGGSITGTGTLTNPVGGTITGPGLINMPFSNAGVITNGAGTLNIIPAWTNNGVVELAGLTSTITGGAVTNNSTIQGYGNLGGSVANNGTIEALGGTLVVGGTLTSLTAGMLEAAAGSKLLVASGLTTNAGLISLVGGTFDNGGFALTNTGQITGYGTLNTGGLTNAGHFTLSGNIAGTTSTITGNVTNNAGQLITIENQPAIFTGNIVNNGTIVTVGTTVTFGGTYSGNAYVSDPSTNIFQSQVTIVTGGSMTGTTGDEFIFLTGSVTNNGSFNNSGQLVSGDNFTNNGTFSQTGSQTWYAGTTFTNTAGTATFGTDAGAGGQNLSINLSGGSVTFSSTQHLASLIIAGGTTAKVTGAGTGRRSVLFTPSLSITGTLDLTSNDLDLQAGGSTGLSTLTLLARQAYNGGKWNGSGITSSSAAGDTTHLTAIGVILNTISGSTPIYTTFDGAAVTVNDVLAKDTYYGDANLDGKVDGSDYSRIDNGYLQHLTGWYNGDFNYDGVANGSDYTLIDNAFNTQGAGLQAVYAEVTAEISSVPEPASFGAVGLVMAMLLGRRRRGIAG